MTPEVARELLLKARAESEGRSQDRGHLARADHILHALLDELAAEDHREDWVRHVKAASLLLAGGVALDRTALDGQDRTSWVNASLAEAEALFGTLGKRSGVGHCLHVRAQSAMADGRLDVAKTSDEEALAIFQSLTHHGAAAKCLESLARLAQQTGRRDEVEGLFRGALAEYEEALDRRSRAIAEAMKEAHVLNQGPGGPSAGDGSDVFLFSSFHGYLALADYQGRLEVLYELGVLAKEADRLPESEAWLRAALNEPEAWLASWSTDVSGFHRARALLELARVVRLDGRGEEAAAVLREALRIARGWHDEREPGWPVEAEPRWHVMTVLWDRYRIPLLAAPILCELGDVLRTTGQVPAAKRAYREARGIYGEVLVDHLGARRCLLALAEVCTDRASPTPRATHTAAASSSMLGRRQRDGRLRAQSL